MSLTKTTCPICHIQFPLKYIRKGIRQKYCSKSCRYTSEWTEAICATCGKNYRIHRLGISRNRIYCSLECTKRNPCLICGTIISGRNTTNGGVRRFCSRKCACVHNITLQGKKNYIVRCFASTIIRLGGLRCERCGLDDLGTLTAHHRDRNHSNNEDVNLETLCGSCHQKEHKGGSKSRAAIISVARLLAKHLQLTPNPDRPPEASQADSLSPPS